MTATDEVLRRFARHQHGPQHVGLPDSKELLSRQIHERRKSAEPGVVDQHVVVPVFLDYFADQAQHVVFLAHVSDYRESVNLLRRRFEHVLVSRADRDTRAALAQKASGLESNSTASSGDEHRGVLQIHCFSLEPIASRTSETKSVMSASAVSKEVISLASAVDSFQT